MNDREVQEMMRVVAAGYEKLARQAEQRVREENCVCCEANDASQR
jgi:hypothetical protein